MLLSTSLGTESTVLCIQTETTTVVGSFKEAGHDDVYVGRRLQMLDLRFVIAQCSDVLGRQYEIIVTFMMICSSGVPRNFFRGGVQQIQLRTETTGIWGR